MTRTLLSHVAREYNQGRDAVTKAAIDRNMHYRFIAAMSTSYETTCRPSDSLHRVESHHDSWTASRTTRET